MGGNGSGATSLEHVVAACGGAQVPGNVLVALVQEYCYTLRYVAAHGSCREGCASNGDGGAERGAGVGFDNRGGVGRAVTEGAADKLSGGRVETGGAGGGQSGVCLRSSVRGFYNGRIADPAFSPFRRVLTSYTSRVEPVVAQAPGSSESRSGIRRGSGDGLGAGDSDDNEGSVTSKTTKSIDPIESGGNGRAWSPDTPVAWRAVDWRAERARRGNHVSYFEECSDETKMALKESYAATLIARNRRQLVEEERKRSRSESSESSLEDVIRVNELADKIEGMGASGAVLTWARVVAKKRSAEAVSASGFEVPKLDGLPGSKPGSDASGKIVPVKPGVYIADDNKLTNRFANDVEAKVMALGLLSSEELEIARQKKSRKGCFLTISDIKLNQLVVDRGNSQHFYILDDANERMELRSRGPQFGR